MAGEKGSAELLRIIAETVGADDATPDAWRSGRAVTLTEETPAERRRALMLFRMVRAFRALPDDASRMRALQLVEGLSASPIRAD